MDNLSSLFWRVLIPHVIIRCVSMLPQKRQGRKSCWPNDDLHKNRWALREYCGTWNEFFRIYRFWSLPYVKWIWKLELGTVNLSQSCKNPPIDFVQYTNVLVWIIYIRSKMLIGFEKNSYKCKGSCILNKAPDYYVMSKSTKILLGSLSDNFFG